MSATTEQLVNDFIDEIAVLRPYTRVTKEAKRRLMALFDQQMGKEKVSSGEMHEILMNYGKVCEEQGFLSPQAVTIRMDIATYFNDLLAQLSTQKEQEDE